MPRSSRFSVAVHILSFLALDRSQAKTSDQIAESICTNPAVVRRLLQDLSGAGLTQSQLGKGGGARLACGPKRISLLEIYQAVEVPGLVAMPRTTPSKTCAIGRNIQPVLLEIAKSAEQAFLETLNGHTLKSVMKSIKAAEAA